MKISIDGNQVLELSEVQKRVIKNDIKEDIFEQDIHRRLQHVIMHKYEECFKRLKSEWEPRLKANGVKAIPLDEEEFAQLVFSQPDYKSRSQRESGV